MRKADAQRTPTVHDVVHRAVEVCDPEGTSDAAAALLERFEDRDEPVTAAGDIEEELAEAKGADPRELLVLAARAEFDGDPPEPVASWLAERGVAP